ncbi:hypothetical protein [Acrocarpospora catenulata]|uniref:hypothetical protein n=1 Tax=Acrocarpospora catenulata TaxID=2836182 RepID=UPI0027E0FD5D|nr:hypothetical protein [Acrocarpospora catenulata]
MTLTAWGDGDPVPPAEFHHRDDVFDILWPDHGSGSVPDEVTEILGCAFQRFRSGGEGAAELRGEPSQQTVSLG